MDDPAQILEAANLAAKRARGYAVLTLAAVFVAVMILVLDNQIKRSILEEVTGARNVLDQFRALAVEAVRVNGQAQQGGADSGADRVGAGGVADVAGPSAAADPDEGAGSGPAGSRRVGSQRRPRGDG